MARGLSAIQGVNAAASGFAQGVGLAGMLNEQKYRAQDRGLAMADRERNIRLQDEQIGQQKQDREREDQARFVMEQWARAKGGLDVDQEGLKKYGIDPAKHFDPKIGEWSDVAQGVLSGQISGDDPKALEMLNWRLSDQINKGVGAKIQQGYTSADGQQIPAGAEIVSKQVVGMKPAPGGESLVAALRVTAKTPDGKTISYIAPATEGRDSSPNAPMLQIPVRSLIQMAQGDSLIADAWKSPQFQKELEARIVGLTGKPMTPADTKVKFETVQVGDNNVTYAVRPDGSMEEVGRGTLPAIRSAQIRASAQRDSSGKSKAAGGADQQMLEYLKSTIFTSEKDEPKRTQLAIDKLKEIKRAAASSKDPNDAINKVAQALLTRKTKDRRGEESYQFTPQQAFETARGLLGTMASDGDGADAENAAEQQGEEDFSALWGE